MYVQVRINAREYVNKKNKSNMDKKIKQKSSFIQYHQYISTS